MIISSMFVAVRLVDGKYNGEGRVEIYYKHRWGTVCDNTFTKFEAMVVCKQLGYAWYVDMK